MSSTPFEEFRKLSKDLMKQVQTGRCAHILDLLNVYMEAIIVDMPSVFISTLEIMIGDVEKTNTAKLVVDVKKILEHNNAIKKLRQQGHKNDQELFVYCCNNVVTPLVKKLVIERESHLQMLGNILGMLAEAKGAHSNFYRMVETMFNDRETSNHQSMVEEAILLQECS